MNKLVIIGASGHGKVIADTVKISIGAGAIKSIEESDTYKKCASPCSIEWRVA